ncbi:DEKNAAC100034 [Brettanomyces naardenensis]|uniref:DEKNAAC100034 n=1 Tax=Brettanomyces naardenensis TaxID=13370 RepID=A0A448YFF5_BRENA|nr:DEKNAAC100034 [Brettanomyces naardenensis]
MQNLPKEDIAVTMGNSMPMELGQLGPMGPMGPLQALESIDSTDAIPPAVSMAPMTTIPTIIGGAPSMSAMSSSSSTLPMSDSNVGLQIQIEEWDKPVIKNEVGNIINGSLEPSANDELSISDNVISREIGELESGWKRRREDSIGEPCKRTRVSPAVQLQSRSKRQLSSEEHLQVPFSPSLQQPQQRPGNKFLKCFSILRTNYLNLCSTYNGVLVKYNDSQAERAKLKVQNEELKALMDGLLHEVNILRSRERRKKRQSCNGTWTQKLKIDA